MSKLVKKEDVEVFRPLKLALNFHAGRRRTCCGCPCPQQLERTPDFYFLSITKIDEVTNQLFVDDRDFWKTPVNIPKSPSAMICYCIDPSCCDRTEYSMASSLWEPRTVWTPKELKRPLRKLDDPVDADEMERPEYSHKKGMGFGMQHHEHDKKDDQELEKKARAAKIAAIL